MNQYSEPQRIVRLTGEIAGTLYWPAAGELNCEPADRLETLEMPL